MSTSKPVIWSEIGQYSTGDIIERIHHAGLSVDGRLRFVAAFQEEAYLVWDIRSAKQVWTEDGAQSAPVIGI
jgi:hypothetical protein